MNVKENMVSFWITVIFCCWWDEYHVMTIGTQIIINKNYFYCEKRTNLNLNVAHEARLTVCKFCQTHIITNL